MTAARTTNTSTLDGPPLTTSRRIVDAATELFAERGYHASTVREIAGRLGIKAGSLYNHYDNKHAILAEITASTMRELIEGGTAAVAAHEEPAAQLRALVAWHVEYHARNRLRCRVADEELRSLDEDARGEVLALRDEYENMLKQVLRAGARTEGWKIADVSVVSFAVATMCTAVVTWFRDDGKHSASEVGAMYADLALAAVRGCDD